MLARGGERRATQEMLMTWHQQKRVPYEGRYKETREIIQVKISSDQIDSDVIY